MDPTLDLPERVALYLREEGGDGVDLIGECFTADARVIDEGKTHHGWGEIRAWKRAAKARYRYRIEPLSVNRDGDVLRLRVRVEGDFAGSPIELGYAITVADGRIAVLEIG